ADDAFCLKLAPGRLLYPQLLANAERTPASAAGAAAAAGRARRATVAPRGSAGAAG
nr:hypothetical protein [Tanacetum cinerariifolium]